MPSMLTAWAKAGLEVISSATADQTGSGEYRSARPDPVRTIGAWSAAMIWVPVNPAASSALRIATNHASWAGVPAKCSFQPPT